MRGRLGRRYDKASRILVACLRGGMVLPDEHVAVLADGQATERDRESLLAKLALVGLTAGRAGREDGRADGRRGSA